MVKPIPMVDPITMVDSIPMSDSIPMVDPIPMVEFRFWYLAISFDAGPKSNYRLLSTGTLRIRLTCLSLLSREAPTSPLVSKSSIFLVGSVWVNADF